MRRLWNIIYSAGAVYCFAAGYATLSPANSADTNADFVFVTLTFAICGIFPSGAMGFSHLLGVRKFRKPSLERQPLGWWYDTLQPIRVSLASALCLCLGSSFALPRAGHQGVMMFWFYVAMTAGLFIGERIVYRLYSKEIS